MKDSETFVQKGRGAISNREGRFESTHTELYDDGWDSLALEPPAKLKTTVHIDAIRSIITKNQSPDIPFEQSINPYRGCEHGCIYCYARPSHTYLGHSAGLDFETKLYAKSGAGEVLDKTFRKRNYEVKPITIGANTDPYQPIEKRYGITREILETMYAFKHPTHIITKGALILRDIPLLSKMAQLNLIHVMVSITTLEVDLAHRLEPRAAAPHRRIQIVQALADAGIPVSINAAPMIPAINDIELEKILEAGVSAGAQGAMYILLRLPNEVKDLFREWLNHHYPDRARHVMSLIQQMRGGADNESTFGVRFSGRGPYAQMLNHRYQVACRRLGLNRDLIGLNLNAFKPPPRIGDQMELF